MRRLAKRMALVLMAPLLVALVELCLRLSGFGFPTSFFIASDKPGILRTNERFAWRFTPPQLARAPVPQMIAAKKPAGTKRIFVLGSSAAQGYPDPAYSIGRFLEVMLNDGRSATRYEVINCAMTAMNSHVARAIAAECARYEPDYFLVYCGNNEVIGPFGPGTVFAPFEPGLRTIRFKTWLSSLRLSQAARLVARGAKGGGAAAWGGMEMFAASRVPRDDQRLDAVHANFRENINAICTTAARLGATTLLCSVPVNLRDCPPFAPTNGVGISQAQKLFDEARQLEQAGKKDEALAKYREACDADELRFRADSRINAQIGEIAKRRASDVAFVDLARMFSGHESFCDHVHLNLHATWRATAEVFKTMTSRPEFRSFDQCCEALAYTPFDAYRIEKQIAQLKSRAPFTFQSDHARQQKLGEEELAGLKQMLTQEVATKSRARYEAAIRARPEDHLLLVNFAEMLAASGDHAGAVAMWRRVVGVCPHHVPSRLKLAEALGSAGDTAGAIDTIQRVAQRMPQLPAVQKALGDMLARQGDREGAKRCYRKTIDLFPGHATALANLATLRMKEGADGVREAEALIARALAASDEPIVHTVAAQMFALRNDAKGALPHYEKAIAGLPDDASLRNNYGAALLSLGRVDEAEAQFLAALKIDPDHAKARRSMEFIRRQRSGEKP